ncbi:AsmA family protein [Aeromonas enteropelogenes]|uniref:AsmA family protein n=1 Tax=Aeromonas enteropelogenes TaxID=29489 RepID=UPI00228552A0|nr:AsmA family protein [Aeromonas enteropelogenes]
MKKIIYILLGLVLSAVIAITALISLIDPNQFKPQLTEQVRKVTGRELVMAGNIDWRFWPSLGLSLEKVALRNPAGFAEPDLIRFEQGSASVALLPLLSHRLEIGEVTLAGAHLFIQTKADGSSNLSGLLSDKSSAEPATAEEAKAPAREPQGAPAESKPWQIKLKGVVLEQASALVQDDRNGIVSRLDRLDLDLGQLAMGQWVPVTFAAKGVQGQLAFDLKGQGEVKLAQNALASELKGVVVGGSLKQPSRQLDNFTLKANRLALGEWSNLALSLQGAQGEGEQPALTGSLEGTLKARVDQDLKLAELSDVVLSATLNGDTLPHPQMNLKLAGFARAELEAKKVTLSKLVMSADDTLLTGEGAVQLGAVPKVEFDLKGETLDLDSWLGTSASAAVPAPTTPASASNKAAEPAKVTRALSAVEPNLDALKAIDAIGRLQLGSLRVRGLDLGQLDTQLALANGQLTLKQFSAGVAGGKVMASGVLDARQQPARYQVSKRVQGVNVHSLLQTLAQNDLLEGRGDLDVQVQGQGLSEQALRSRMQGKITLALHDGALHGINLAEMIREARATLTGKGTDQVKEVRKTDFSALTASFQLANGVARSDDIQLFAPALRVHGQGQAALVPETLDFLFLTSIVESSKGQGGKGVDELKDITIPVRIGGQWQAPTYRLDVKALLSNNKILEEKARKEAERGLKKLLGDKADNEGVKGVADQLLKGLFK